MSSEQLDRFITWKRMSEEADAAAAEAKATQAEAEQELDDLLAGMAAPRQKAAS